MLLFLKRAASSFIGIVLGVTVLPVLSLARSSWDFAALGINYLKSAFGAFIHFNQGYRLNFFNRSRSLVQKIIATILYFPAISMVLVAHAIALSLIASGFVALSVYLAFTFMYNGLVYGYKNGISGVYSIVKHFELGIGFQIDQALQRARAFNLHHTPQDAMDIPIQPNEFDGFELNDDEIPQNLVDVEVEHDPELDEKEASHQTENRFTEEELKEAQALTDRFSTLSNPLEPALKSKLQAFNSAVEQYKNLSEKLKAVHDHLVAGTLDDIEDELIPYSDIKQPILVVKQYCENEKWKTVPTMNHVGEYESFKTWLRGMHPNHPRSGESFRSPPPYTKPGDEKTTYPTRHVWFKLTKEYCYASGLGELKDGILELMQALNEGLKANENAKIINPANVEQGLFVTAKPDNDPEQVTATPSLQLIS